LTLSTSSSLALGGVYVGRSGCAVTSLLWWWGHRWSLKHWWF
jgi:hypothetical protein